MVTKRPAFKRSKGPSPYDSPEELFSKLPNREKSHGYLRGPQADALREYLARDSDSDIALELPTGTGKTTVGLLIAEWCRRKSGKRAAYLTLTNQLGGQVLEEAQNLGIDCADLRGTRDTRDIAEVGRYQASQAVAITTYSNLFNVNPVVQFSDVLIFDDAHGGEQFVSNMWTVRVRREVHLGLYDELLACLRPSLSDVQFRVLMDESLVGQVEIADIHRTPDVIVSLTSALDDAEDISIRLPWGLIRNHLDACLVFVTAQAISIRPVVPPTHTHGAFIGTRQRVYMSATLGGEGDLRRSYGITNITTARAPHPQWGKRYVFTPGLFVDSTAAIDLVAKVWKGMNPKRALLLSPSFLIGDRVYGDIAERMEPPPVRLDASDIEVSLEAFTNQGNRLLALAGRYDGLDLPGDDCRLLIMAESPGAIGPLERHQRDHWKLGPLLRRRERTRLIQGMGRCTRDATDFAAIILLGQSLVNSITNPDVTQGLPPEIQREIQWGIGQCDSADNDIESLAEMILGLLTDASYRKEANENQDDIALPDLVPDSEEFERGAKSEVLFSRALWERNLTRAYDIARIAADEATAEKLAGYRAWWFYLASIAARSRGDLDQEVDCLRRARATGINSGYLDHLLRTLGNTKRASPSADDLDGQIEEIWTRLETWGWHGPDFARAIQEMTESLSPKGSSTKYHLGLERLGECVGAEVLRPTAEGAPDVVWIFPTVAFTIEAKSEKGKGASISKRDVQQAKGHVDWLKSERPDLENVTIVPIIVSPSQAVDPLAIPYLGGLNHISVSNVLAWARDVSKAVRGLRTEFAGKDFPTARIQFKAFVKHAGLDLDSVHRLLSTPLKPN